MHASAYDDAAKFVSKYLKDVELKIADIGSYNVNGTLKSLFANPKWLYTGYDIIPGPDVDVVISGEYHWPEIPSHSCDVVVSSQVVEHVRHPWRWIKEVARICKNGGIVYVCTPNTIHFHEHPVDCWRVWPDGMKALFDEAGLIPVEVYAAGQDTTGIATKKVVPFLL